MLCQHRSCIPWLTLVAGLLVTNALATLLQRARQLELHDSGDRCKFLLNDMQTTLSHGKPSLNAAESLVFSSADLLEAHALRAL